MKSFEGFVWQARLKLFHVQRTNQPKAYGGQLRMPQGLVRPPKGYDTTPGHLGANPGPLHWVERLLEHLQDADLPEIHCQKAMETHVERVENVHAPVTPASGTSATARLPLCACPSRPGHIEAKHTA